MFSVRTTLGPEREGYRTLSTDELDRIREAFIAASLLAEEAGADGIDFKMCHGYLGSEILRPGNTRNDKWGGGFENRTRLLTEIVSGLKTKIKNGGFILGSRISMYEGIRGGCGTCGPDEIVEDPAQMLDVIRLMAKLGMDYVNVSAGIPAVTGAITRPTEPSKYLALSHLRYTKTIKEMINRESVNLKVIGSAYSAYKSESPALCAEMVQKNYTDICGFGRQSFADPLTPVKLQSGAKINWCTLCSGCTKLMAGQRHDGCVVYNEYYRREYKKLSEK
jgi:2,4-dienoyl-CoA reductase-like NADH-dependent reductase (Old Yellow Enzyme family)